MSIQSEINRISGNVSDALDAIEDKGVTIPSGANSDDLADLISQIESGGGGGGSITQDQDGYLVLDDEAPPGSPTLITKTITQNGTYDAEDDDADGYSSVTVTVSGGGGGGDLTAYIDGTITSIAVPNGTTAIRTYAFSYCTLLSSISIPSSVVSIGANAFNYCTSLTSVTATGAIGGLLASTFYNCGELLEVHFPNLTGTIASNVWGNTTASYACRKLTFADLGNATSLGTNAFNNCAALKTIVLRNTDGVCSLANINTFTNTPFRKTEGGTAYVPNALISAYQTAANWSTIYDAGTITFSALENSQYA